MSAPDPTPPTDQLLKEAAAWFARMRGPDAENHREAFEAWLRRGALHRQAYNRASEIFAMGKHLRESETAPSGEPRASLAGRRLLVPLTAVLILAAAAWFVLGQGIRSPEPGQIVEGPSDPRGTSQRVTTKSGETRSTRLQDGSLVSLRAETRIDIRFDRQVRRLLLERGIARFAVAHEARPLVVEAGGGEIRALGTLFEVGIGTDRRVTVRLIEGIVEVTPPAVEGVRPGPRRLLAGQSMTYAASPAIGGNGLSEQPRPASSQPPAGGSAARDYDNVPLAELIAAANRGAGRRIRLADPAVGALRVSGRFSIGDTALLGERLALLFDLVRADDQDGDIVLRRR